MRHKRLSDQMRQAVLDAPMSRYAMAAQTGIDEASLSRFVHRKAGLPLASIDKLADLLGWNLAQPQAKQTTKAKPKAAKPKQRSAKRG